ncbi:MAG: MFS transporter [Lacisediminihabitans sp.]
MRKNVTRGWRLLVALGVVNVTLFASYSGVLSVLLPRQIAGLDPTGKVGVLAAATSISFAVTALAQPLFGALSDRTRGAWGRRVPWMLAGALVGGAALGALGGTQSIITLIVLWSLAQFALNATDIAASAYLVDGFPPHRRGTAAGILGLTAITGGALGSVVAGVASSPPAAAYWILAIAVLAATGVFAVTVRDTPTLSPRRVLRTREFFRRFIVDPRRHPNFWWVFSWRLFFTLSTGVVQGYLLYILTDYLLVADDEAVGIVSEAIVIGGLGVVVSVILSGWLSDKAQRRKPFLLAASVVVLIADVVPFVAPSVTTILVLAGGIGVGLGISIACGTALASEVLPHPDTDAGRGLGLFNVATNLGQALAPVAAAIVIAWVGYPWLFVTSAVFIVLAALLILPVRMDQPSNDSQEQEQEQEQEQQLDSLHR